MRSIKKRYKRKHPNIFVTHVQNNIREYTIASIIFIIGVLLGIVFINNLSETQANDISTYISESIFSIKTNGVTNSSVILKKSIGNNILLVILLWLLGSTVIGLLLVYIIVAFKGFSFGFVVSAIIYSLEKGKAILFIISAMLLKNIIAIPCVVALAVSGMKFYKAIMVDRRKENVKLEIIRHTLFSVCILIFLVISSFIEIYVSQNILKYCSKFL